MQDDICSLHITDVAVRKYFNLTAQELFYFSLALNFLLCTVGFGLGTYLGRNIVLLSLYPLIAFLHLPFSLFQLSFLNLFAEAHRETMEESKKHIREKNESVIVFCEYFQHNKFRLVVFTSTIIFMISVLGGVYLTRDEGFAQLKKAIENSRSK